MHDGAEVRCQEASLQEIREELPPHIVEYLMSKYTQATLLICSNKITEVFILSKVIAEVVGRVITQGLTPYAAGLYLGRLRKNKPRFIPSTNILQEMFRETEELINALIVAEEGLKPFLYGGDILRKSVVSCYEPVRKGEVVAVLGTDKIVYGLGLSRIRSCEELENMEDLEEVASNVFDVGWYIRGEARKERKYKG
ncbi:MAG: hypothetical protein QN229_04070 [Desulfurococcaceae archaeon TW002]